MLGVEMYTTIKTLWKKTRNKSEIARVTGHDWKTVSKVIRDIEKGIEIPRKKPKKTIVDDYRETLTKLLGKDLSALRIHQELLRDGFTGSYSTVKKYVSMIKKRDDIFIRIHTDPGEEA